MSLHGSNVIGWAKSAEGSDVINAVNPATGLPLPGVYFVAADSEIDRAVKLAEHSLAVPVPPSTRAKFLRAVADNIEGLGEALLAIANIETSLPLARLAGERNRTTNQLRQFADLVSEGSWVDARIDLGDPNRQPLPKPDLRRMLAPIGPVAVYGSSNFPFAYSVAGGDTASAFAAGCPVIVKAHPAHPGTSELTAEAIVDAARKVDMPEGTFSMVHGGNHVGIALIRHPSLAAAGFTGSLQGGRALMLAAGARERPIPVHAEMGSVNPVFLLPSALENRWQTIASDLSQSVTNCVGQFCTKPGVVVAIDGPILTEFKQQLSILIAATAPGTMLTSGIRSNYQAGVQRMHIAGARTLVAPDRSEIPETLVNSAVFETDASSFIKSRKLGDEVFGPATLIVNCQNTEELLAVAHSLHGQLTASVHGEPNELAEYAVLMKTLTSKAGRLIFNGYPTGVEVNPSMTHGGPYPATSDVRYTSVGTAAISRFARPLTWQNAPEEQLPLELHNSNPLKITRLVNGVVTSEQITTEKLLSSKNL